MKLPRRKYELWIRYERNGEVVGGPKPLPPYRKFWSRRGAENRKGGLDGDPRIFCHILDAAIEGKGFVFPEIEVRTREDQS